MRTTRKCDWQETASKRHSRISTRKKTGFAAAAAQAPETPAAFDLQFFLLFPFVWLTLKTDSLTAVPKPHAGDDGACDFTCGPKPDLRHLQLRIMWFWIMFSFLLIGLRSPMPRTKVKAQSQPTGQTLRATSSSAGSAVTSTLSVATRMSCVMKCIELRTYERGSDLG